MKGKLWELAPIVIAAAIALGFAIDHWRVPAAPTAAAVPAPGAPLVSKPDAPPAPGSGDTARPDDMKPDSASNPDPGAPPDSHVAADAKSPPDLDAKPASPAPAH